MSTPIVAAPDGFALPEEQRRFIKWTIYLGFIVLAFGVLNGLDQALNYAHIDIFRFFPGMRTYYQGLTAHGVFNAIIMTFAFANGFVALLVARGLGTKLNSGILAASFFTILIGTLLTAGAIVSGSASVLYTFYAPLEASWPFYLGLALVVISTWITSLNLFVMLAKFRREHPGERIPLLAYMGVVTYIFWDIASAGIAIEVVAFLLPWSLGLWHGADPMVDRTLFWFTGHPIVYFWLLPVYMSWYGTIPRQVNGALFSDSVVRIGFLLFLIIIPVGFHHQFVDPGVPLGLKFAVAVLTFALFVPSLMTAFSVMYALEIGGRRAGGSGLIGWFFRIPWKDPSVCAQVLAMLAFMLGGITGLMNASYNMNLEIHNTTFVPGHFHLTVGTAVALSIMGIAYWLVPYLEQKELWSAKVALVSSWLYFIGVLIFARGMISGGLAGMPRRTAISLIPYAEPPGWKLAGILVGVGGSMMFAGALLFFVVIGMTVVAGKRTRIADIPYSVTIPKPKSAGWEAKLDRLGYWIAIALVLCVVVYGPFLASQFPLQLNIPGFRAF
jgi:cytochrome c oxidase subunit 1